MVSLHTINRYDKYIIFHPESLSIFYVSEDIGRFLEIHELGSMNSDIGSECTNHAEISDEEVLTYFEKRIKLKSCEDLKWTGPEPKTLCLIVSQDCNLRCGYCYADHGTFGEDKRLMSFETSKKCIDKILGREFDNSILFFGGEPFLNFSLMKEIIEYGRKAKMNINYTTITNGTIMNDAIKMLINENFFELSISLDGPKAINDIQRYGSVDSVYDRVVDSIEQLNGGRCPLAIKCIVTKNSINNLTNIAEHISSLGVGSMAFADVSRIPNDSKFIISDSEFERYVQELSEILVNNLQQLAMGRKTTAISPILSILRQLITRTRVIHICSAGREYIAVTANGDVYPCHGFVGMDQFKMGNVYDEAFPGEAFDKIKKIFMNHSIYRSEECSSCWARFLCGGDCAVHSYIYNGDLYHPTKRRCILTKSILNAILPEIAEIFQDKNKIQNIIKRFDSNANVA